jgi:ABC-type transport system involved in multi-copper enzyme maturation permease subunit
MSILLVASNTFRQVVRQRLFLNVVVFGVGMLLLSMVLGEITFGYVDRVVRSVGLSGVTVALDLMALLISVTLIHQEIDKKTLFVVLTRPLERWQYVAGRFLGLLAALTLVLLGFSVVYALTLLAARGSPELRDVWALAAALPEAAVLAGFGLVLSSFSTPTLASGLGLGFWIVAATTDDLARLTQKADGLTRLLAQVLYWVLPSFARFDFRTAAVHALEVDPVDYLMTWGYGAIYALALVALAGAILDRREMV